MYACFTFYACLLFYSNEVILPLQDVSHLSCLYVCTLVRFKHIIRVHPPSRSAQFHCILAFLCIFYSSVLLLLSLDQPLHSVLSTFLFWFHLVTPRIIRTHHMTKLSMYLTCLATWGHASLPHGKVEKMIDLNNLCLVLVLIPLSYTTELCTSVRRCDLSNYLFINFCFNHFNVLNENTYILWWKNWWSCMHIPIIIIKHKCCDWQVGLCLFQNIKVMDIVQAPTNKFILHE